MEAALSFHQNRVDWTSMNFVSDHLDIAQVMPENLSPAARSTLHRAAKDNIHPSLTHIANVLSRLLTTDDCRDWSMGTNPVKRGCHDQLLRYYV